MRALAADIASIDARRYEGRIAGVQGLTLEATGPAAALGVGARARIETHHGPASCEIVGFHRDRAVLMPFGPMDGVSPGARIDLDAAPATARPSRAWLGRVLDAFGKPMDGLPPPVDGVVARLLEANPPSPGERARVGARIDLGVRVLNTFAPLCRGQRMGLFAGSGVGKSVLLSMLARRAEADVVVIGLVGERGREVREFVEDTLGPEGLARAVVIVATSDAPALVRRQAAYLTMATAEHFRDEGAHVLCLIDSITRFALAQREIGLAAGEPPTTRGYTPSVFAALPRLLERAGPGPEHSGRPSGAITGLFTVLVDGGDHDEPVADAVRGILDGHIVMERAIAERGRYPAVNVLKSVSRMMPHCASLEENKLIRRARKLLATYGDMEELIRLGAYAPGSNPEVDEAVSVQPALEAFLNQQVSETTSIPDGFAMLARALDGSE